MKGLFVVAAREVVAQRAFIAASAVVAVLITIAPWVPGFTAWEAEDVRGVVFRIVGVGFVFIATLLLGATVIGKELAEGRYAFYLSRPLGGTSIFFGKLLGAVFTIVVCGVVVLASPALLHGLDLGDALREFLGFGSPISQAAIMLIALPALVFLITHVAGVVWRARSMWIVLDLASLVVGGLILWRAWRILESRLITTDAVQRLLVVGPVVMAIALLLIACWVAHVRGRADLKATHAALSVTMSVLVVTCAMSFLGMSKWMVSTEVDELLWVSHLRASPSGQWVAIQGGTKKLLPLRASFLYHHAQRRFVAIDVPTAGPWGSTPVAFSNSGDWAAWLEQIGDDQYQVVVADLRKQEVDITRTRLFLGWQSALAISNDGRWLAVRERRDLQLWQRLAGSTWDINAIYELPSGRLASSWTTADEHESMTPVFVSDITVRTYCKPVRMAQKNPPTDLAVIESDIAADEVWEVGVVPDLESVHNIAVGPSGRVLLMSTETGAGTPSYILLDGGSHERLADVDWYSGWYGTRLLSDGRIATLRRIGPQLEIVLLDHLGEIDQILALGTASGAWLGHQTAPDRMTVVVFDDSPDDQNRRYTSVEINLSSGETRTIGQQFSPVLSSAVLGDVHLSPRPGSVVTRCFTSPNGALRILNPDTGELDEVIPGSEDIELYSWGIGIPGM